jgi:hypothetical protein
MLEREIIQQRGFRNTVENGKVTGFQFRIRSDYYRGAWLSLVRPGELMVDGEKYDNSLITWEIGGKEYSIDQMLKIGDVQWPNMEAAVVKVKKPGGLTQGYHEISYYYRHIASYIPPIVSSDEAFSRMPPRSIETRKLVIV